MSYVICIPSYKRPKVLEEKTLTTLHKAGIPADRIHVYVANLSQYEEYKNSVNVHLYGSMTIGVIGLVQQREFIEQQYACGQRIVFMDDDVGFIDLELDNNFKNYSLAYFFCCAFDKCENTGAYMWGVYPCFNPYFRSARREEPTTELTYIVGALYGVLNRPNDEKLQLKLTRIDSQKEDVERTLLYFQTDGIVLRYNRIGFVTKYYLNDGSGLGRLKDRIVSMMEASHRLFEQFKEFGYLKTRKSGITEFVFSRKKSRHNVNEKKEADEVREQDDENK
jgi:hypothetical protein